MRMLAQLRRTTAVAALAIGIALILTNHLSVKSYTNAHIDNYLAPAGRFIRGDEALTFAVLGDSSLRNTPLEAVLRDIVRGGFDFALHVGDQARRRTSAHFEWLLQEVRGEIGDFPFYAVPGNHDITSGGRHLRFYKRAFGQPHYWFSYGDTLFVCLDTSTIRLPDAQAEWLDQTLTRLRGLFKSCVLFMHVPPIDPRPGGDYGIVEGVERLRGIVQAHSVTAIIAGHIHEFLSGDFAGVPLYIAPASGQRMRGKADRFGYLSVSVDRQGSICRGSG